MAERGRKGLVWEIRKSLLALSPDELFVVANDVGPAPGESPPVLVREDAEGCFNHINAFMYSKHLLESEDEGMVELLELNDAILKILQFHSNVTIPVDSSVEAGTQSTDVASQSSGLDTANVPSTDSVNVTSGSAVSVQPPSVLGIPATSSADSVRPDEVQKMLESYEDLSKKLRQFMNIPTPQSTLQPTPVQPDLQNNNTTHMHMPTSEPTPHFTPVHSISPHNTQNNNKPFPNMPTSHPHHTAVHPPLQNHDTTHHAHQSDTTHSFHTHEKMVSLKDLSYLHRREFKVQGGQIGDHSSDISYNSVCRQMEEGLKENFGEVEIVRGVLRIIKPGDFKDMLMNKDDMTVAELKGFLQSHLGEKSSTELFQELMCAKQNEHETPQQFLYRVIGLKQRILFTSRQAETEIKHSPETVQGVFLHTVYQGIGHKHNDIRREIKPLLSDSTVTDETILKHVMKITSDESERQRRLGSTPRQKHTAAHSARVDTDPVEEFIPKKEAADGKKSKTNSVQ